MEEVTEARGKAGPGGRLDMSHGFVRHIRRNQMARDDYDREVKKAQQKQKRYPPGPPRPKKPDMQVYCPRPRDTRPACGLEDDESSDSNNGTDSEHSGAKLFCLEFEADGGQITSIVVYEDDDAEQVATKISIENHLEQRMKEVLRKRIQEEISKRIVQR